MTETNPHIQNQEDVRVKQIKMTLDLLHSFVDSFKQEVTTSSDLLQLGAMTQLSQKIENTIQNPLKSIFETTASVDNNIKMLVNAITNSFLRSKADIIQEAHKTKSNDNVIYYSLILKDDNIEARDAIFSFYDKYDLLEISEKYPVYFQFVSPDLIGKLYNTEKVDLAQK